MNFDKEVNRKGTFCTQWDYISDRFGENDLLPFTISDTDFEVPTEVSQALEDRLKHPVFGYTRWNHNEFKNSVQNWFHIKHNTVIDQDSIVYTPSVMYGIAKLIELLSEEGEGVIIQTPAYDAFFKTINESQRLLIEDPLIYNNNYYEIDFVHLEKLLANDNNKILLLCSPHNPTGRVWKKWELDKIIILCKTYGVAIIADEIHMDIVRDSSKHIPIINFNYDNIYVATSGTKTFNFPGLVFSYMLIPNPKIREKYLTILKNKDGLSSPSILGMVGTMTAYNETLQWVESLNQYITENINIVENFLSENLPKIRTCSPEASYLMWLDISNTGLTQDEIQNKMIHVGKIAIMDGSIYGGNGHHFIRLNVGCSKNKLIDGLNRLQKALT